MLHIHSPFLIVVHNSLIARNKYFRRDGVASDLILDQVFFLNPLFSNHLVHFPFTNSLGTSLITIVKIEGLRHCHLVPVILLSLPSLGFLMIYVVFMGQLHILELLLIVRLSTLRSRT